MWTILENLLVMVLTIVFLMGGAYLLLLLLDWGLKFKSKDSEQAGLTDLWIETQKQVTPPNDPAGKVDPHR